MAARIPRWIRILHNKYEACESGTKHLVRYASLEEAWEKTNNPYDLRWALYNLPQKDMNADDRGRMIERLSKLIEGAEIIMKFDKNGRPDRISARKLSNYIRLNFTRPVL